MVHKAELCTAETASLPQKEVTQDCWPGRLVCTWPRTPTTAPERWGEVDLPWVDFHFCSLYCTVLHHITQIKSTVSADTSPETRVRFSFQNGLMNMKIFRIINEVRKQNTARHLTPMHQQVYTLWSAEKYKSWTQGCVNNEVFSMAAL